MTPSPHLPAHQLSDATHHHPTFLSPPKGSCHQSHLLISTLFRLPQRPFSAQLHGSLIPSHPNHPIPRDCPCKNRRCNTCPYTSSLDYIKVSQQSFQVRQRYTCTSSNIIYCIQCSQCGFLYISETKHRLGEHFTEHLRSDQLCLHDLPVANHFNSSTHSLTDLLSWASSTVRFRPHANSTSYFTGSLQPSGMNIDFPNFK